MLTDRAPYEFLYLSRRLLTDLFDHEEAVTPRWRGSVDLNLPFLGLHLQRRAPNRDNLRDLAIRSSELISDQTGAIADPSYFVAGECEAYLGVFAPHLGWDGKIASIRMKTAIETGERVIVALFGSATNVVGSRAADDLETDFYPSDASGLYSLLDAARERNDPEIDLNYRWGDAELTNKTRAEKALIFAQSGALQSVGKVQFLARVFQQFEQDQVSDAGVDRLIVGTPIWVATAASRPLQPSSSFRRPS